MTNFKLSFLVCSLSTFFLYVAAFSRQPQQQSAWSDFSENLWLADQNANTGNGSSCSLASSSAACARRCVKLGGNADHKLCSTYDLSLNRRSTYKTMLDVLDNYNFAQGISDDNTAMQKSEEERFLDSIMSTDIMQQTYDFLRAQGIGKIATPRQFRGILHELWFTRFSRQGRHQQQQTPSGGVHREDSSSFEHIFHGETRPLPAERARQPGELEATGAHSLVALCELERRGEFKLLKTLDSDRTTSSSYSSPQQVPKLVITKIRSKLGAGREQGFKPVTSVACGFSPEAELALCTACFLRSQQEQNVQEQNYNRFQSSHSRGHQHHGAGGSECLISIAGEAVKVFTTPFWASRLGRRAVQVIGTCYFEK